MKLKNQFRKYSLATLACLSVVVFTGCGSSSSSGVSVPETPKPNNPVKPKPNEPAEPVKPKPNEPTEPVKPDPIDPNNPYAEAPKLEDLNEKLPKEGEFLGTEFVNQEKSRSIVRIYRNTYGEEELYFGHKEYYSGGTGKTWSTGIRKNGIYKDENGKVISIHMSDKVLYPASLAHLNKNHPSDSTSYQMLNIKDEGTNSIYKDPGLYEGGKFAGVYLSRLKKKRLDGTPYIVYRDPAVAGWNYQTFGNFQVANGGTQEELKAREAYESIGIYTKKDQLPQTGKATYKGISVGHIASLHKNYRTTANVEVVANFSNKSVGFKTMNTKQYKIDSGSFSYNGQKIDNYNLEGIAKINNDGSFESATLKTKDGKFTGELKGNFYGDKAQEVGGVFGVQTNNKSETYIGGFGAKRP